MSVFSSPTRVMSILSSLTCRYGGDLPAASPFLTRPCGGGPRAGARAEGAPSAYQGFPLRPSLRSATSPARAGEERRGAQLTSWRRLRLFAPQPPGDFDV